MQLIDRKLGGTTPMDILLDAPANFYQSTQEEQAFLAELDLESEGSAGITGTSYWFNSYKLPDINAIHDYLNGLPESGKVLSISSTMRLLA